METLASRFDGNDGGRRLREALARQTLVGNDAALIEALVPHVRVRNVASGTELIRQGEHTYSLFFILMGSAKVFVNTREVAVRRGGQHVGEMAVTDTSASRSATVIAEVDSVVAEVNEPDFVAIANTFPVLWRRIAVEMGERLRERGRSLRPPNPVPRLFIGSTVEALTYAQHVQAALSHNAVIPKVWTDGYFSASAATMESLEAALDTSDYACFIVTGDDITRSRESTDPAPRDNVIFELGLFMGRLGRDRTFMLRPREMDIKVPSDLKGITMLDYTLKLVGGDLPAAVAPACLEMRTRIRSLGSI